MGLVRRLKRYIAAGTDEGIKKTIGDAVQKVLDVVADNILRLIVLALASGLFALRARVLPYLQQSITLPRYALVIAAAVVALAITMVARMLLRSRERDAQLRFDAQMRDAQAHFDAQINEVKTKAEGELHQATERIKQAEEMADRDSTTGLYNLAALRKTLSAEVARAHQLSEPLTMIFIDVDRFKELNKKVGKEKATKLLNDIASVLKGRENNDLFFRPGEGNPVEVDVEGDSDMTFRYGGDEFIVLARMTTTRGGKEQTSGRRFSNGFLFADRLRDEVSRTIFPGMNRGDVTISGGVADTTSLSHDKFDWSPATLINRADQALEKAKQTRDRVEVYGE